MRSFRNALRNQMGIFSAVSIYAPGGALTEIVRPGWHSWDEKCG